MKQHFSISTQIHRNRVSHKNHCFTKQNYVFCSLMLFLISHVSIIEFTKTILSICKTNTFVVLGSLGSPTFLDTLGSLGCGVSWGIVFAESEAPLWTLTFKAILIHPNALFWTAWAPLGSLGFLGRPGLSVFPKLPRLPGLPGSFRVQFDFSPSSLSSSRQLHFEFASELTSGPLH